jgi:hypothetical protein
MNTQVVKMTPEKARALIENGDNNRPLTANHVEMLAHQMKKGFWVLNGQPIILDADGYVLDGQHRLHAVVASGVTVDLLLVEGVPSAAFSTIDNNKTRNPADALACMGVPNYTDVSSLLLFIERYETTKCHSLSRRFTQAQAVDALKRHPQAVSCVHEFHKYSKGLLPTGSVFGIAYYSKQPKSKIHDYLSQVTSGVCKSSTSAAARMASRMIQNKTTKAKLPTLTVQALSVIAWNYFAEDREPTFIRFSEGQEFPRIK